MSRDSIEQIKEKIVEHSKLIFPIILVALVAVTVLIALQMSKKRDVVEENKLIQEITAEETQEETVDALQENAFPEVNALIMNYYQAMIDGDVNAIAKLSNSVDDTEKLRVQELSKYIENYPTVDVFTKTGPEENSYIVYVYYQMKFTDYDTPAPGIQAFYVCTNEDGELYMNEGVVETSVTDYIHDVNMQEDVVELFNRVAVEYNDLLMNDPGMSAFLQEMNTKMDESVGEALAAQETQEGVELDASTPEFEGEEVSEAVENAEEAVSNGQVVFAHTTTMLNVRSSDSGTADKVGQLSSGQKVEILEMRQNGWSKIKYEDKEAFVKTEYLSIIEDPSQLEVVGTLVSTDIVNVRLLPDADSERIGVTFAGEKLDLFGDAGDGWSKVKFEDRVAYVKTEYFTKE